MLKLPPFKSSKGQLDGLIHLVNNLSPLELLPLNLCLKSFVLKFFQSNSVNKKRYIDEAFFETLIFNFFQLKCFCYCLVIF